MFKSLCFIFVVSSVEVIRVASFNLTISPDHVHVSEDLNSITFTCTAEVALTGCQFSWWDWYKKAGPLLDLSQGYQSQADPVHLNDRLIGYSYSGRGLGSGDCGVSLQVKGYKRWIVACRVRAESGGWKYAWANLYAIYAQQPIAHTLITREAVVLQGGAAKFMIKVKQPLDYCRFSLPAVSYFIHLSKGAESIDSTGRHRYLGAGLGAGECGLTLANVSVKDNGPAWGYIATTLPDRAEYRFMALIIARGPPTPPTMSVRYTDGAFITATCVAHHSRPVAEITWFLGNDLIRQDDMDDSHAGPQDEWRWLWMGGSIEQTITHQLWPRDDGKELKCVVSHITLAQPFEAKRIISYAESSTATTPMTTPSTATIDNSSQIIPTTTRKPYTTPKTNTATSPIPTSTPHIKTLITTPSTNIATNPIAFSTTNIKTPMTIASDMNATNTTTIAPTVLNCLKTNILDLLCEDYKLRALLLGNTSCCKDEFYEFLVREAGAAARTAELTEVTVKAERAAKAIVSDLEIQAAKSKVLAVELEVAAARSHARAEEIRVQNEEEELLFQRERRSKSS